MDWLYAALLSMTPVGELRIGLPYAVAAGMPLVLAIPLCVIANFLIVPVLFFFLEFIHYRFLHLKHYRSLFDWTMHRVRKRAHAKVERYGYLGLFLLTAIPLPLTGAYTATIAAWFFGMKKLKAAIAIFLGLIVASLIVGLLSIGGVHIANSF